jgi:hypothetical protein
MVERRYSSTFLDLGTGWRWVVSFTPRPLYTPGKGALNTFKASAERVGHVCRTDRQNCVNFLLLKFSFNDVSFLILFWFFTFPFLMIFNFYIIKNSRFKNFDLTENTLQRFLVFKQVVHLFTAVFKSANCHNYNGTQNVRFALSLRCCLYHIKKCQTPHCHRYHARSFHGGHIRIANSKTLMILNMRRSREAKFHDYS